MEPPLCRCDRLAAAAHAALCSESAAPIAAVAQHGRGARVGPAPASGRVAGPEQGGRPALHAPDRDGPAATCA
ncbi:hypothetical protein, partial [Mesorhizobium sp.]|uniref:hypothetical protein n=1 Tax=Mesorhizobium sp. TaxID=1871066 RepID=UPI00257AC39C